MMRCLSYPAPEHARRMTAALALMIPIFIAGCAAEFINAKPAKELNPPPAQANLYAGWRVFQDKCASCHGITATGGQRAPDLLPILRDMNSRQFSELVLKRYDLGNGMSRDASNQSTLDTRIEEILGFNEPPIAMPAWQGEPAVQAHILDLYAYLAARAEGSLGLGRPPSR